MENLGQFSDDAFRQEPDVGTGIIGTWKARANRYMDMYLLKVHRGTELIIILLLPMHRLNI